MYGLIGKMLAAEGKRELLLELLLENAAQMPGCLSYIIAKDPSDSKAIWITEVWDSKDSHQKSLSLVSVQNTIAKARPFIEGFGERYETEPVGGHGLL